MSPKIGRKGPVLTYRQRQVARLTAQTNRRAINKDVDAVLEHIETEARRLGKIHKRSEAWFLHQFYQGGRVVRQRRAVNVFNAARQIQGFLEGRKLVLTDAEKERFQEIATELKVLNGPENACKLPLDMQKFLKEKTQAWRDEKHTAARASARAVVQDARVTLDRVSDELMSLTARTDVQTFLFAVKGRPEHTMEGYVSTSEKGGRFLLHGMKKLSSDIVKEFESYVLGDIQGLVLNHNQLLTNLKGKIRAEIREGLVAITGDPKAMMQYDRYKKLIVVAKGVELVNWPNDVPFMNASDIGSLTTLRRLSTALTLDDVDERCHWVTLSKEEWDRRRTAYYEAEAEAEPKKRKRKARVEDPDETDSSEAEVEERDKTKEGDKSKKKSKKAKPSDKENAPATVSATKSQKGGKKGTGKGKGKANKAKSAEKPMGVQANAPLAPVGTN